MEVLVRIVIGALLLAHGLVHLMWFAPNDDPTWPFRLDRSWLMSDEARKPVAMALVALVVAGFAMLGLALVLFWDRQLLWGVAIDVTLLVVALWRPGWTDRFG